MKQILVVGSLVLLGGSMLFSAGCRRKRPEPAPAETPSVEAPVSVAETSPKLQAPAPSAPSSAKEPVTVENFQSSTEFADLTKDFQLYCARKGRVPTDINEFFQEQKIKPPPIPPGTRLAIDAKERRIVLLK